MDSLDNTNVEVVASMTANEAMAAFTCLMICTEGFIKKFGDDSEMMSSFFSLIDKSGLVVVDIAKKNGDSENEIAGLVAQLDVFKAIEKAYKARDAK